MHRILRTLLIFVVLANVINLRATEIEAKLQPLSVSAANIHFESANPDFSSLGYVAIRGAALYLALGIYVESNPGGRDGEAALAKQYKEQATTLIYVGTYLNKRVDHMSDDAIIERLKMLSSLYAGEMKSNKLMNNVVITDFIKNDLLVVKNTFPLINTISLELLKNEAKKSEK